MKIIHWQKLNEKYILIGYLDHQDELNTVHTFYHPCLTASFKSCKIKEIPADANLLEIYQLFNKEDIVKAAVPQKSTTDPRSVEKNWSSFASQMMKTKEMSKIVSNEVDLNQEFQGKVDDSEELRTFDAKRALETYNNLNNEKLFELLYEIKRSAEDGYKSIQFDFKISSKSYDPLKEMGYTILFTVTGGKGSKITTKVSW